MGLYRVIVVDDEEEIREGIIRKIDWETLGFEVAGSAENGLDALEMAEHLHPDVVMTDIKMPFMDGLGLCKKISEQMPSVKLIIFSGFDDFEYAQKAIKLNVAEYMLKPVNAQELSETLKKLKRQLDQELIDRRDIETLRHHYEESLPVLREQFLVGLLEGRVPEQKLRAQAGMYRLNLRAKYWTVALIHAGAGLPGTDARALHDAEELIPISIARTVEEILGRFCHFTSFLYSDNVAILADFPDAIGVTSLITGLNEVCKSASRVLEGDIAAGIGGLTADLNGIRRSYREAQSALDYSSIMGEGRAVYIKDVEPDASVQVQFDEQDERAILNAIKLGGEEDITKVINELFSRIETILPFSQYQVYLVEMVTSLLKVIRTYELNTDEIFGKDFNYFTAFATHSPSKIRQWMIESCCKISVQIKRERLDSTKLLARNAKLYIEEHYMDPEISVEMLCAHLHVSPAYFSTVFKRETEMSFVSYLTEVRLQQALNLLNTTDDKTYVIAGKVGYTEPNYFSYVFKKRFGVSPSKYRTAGRDGANV
ncbi:response regulator [Clostridium sp. D33t1_170424_F3]|uniref:response regulator n=1 Tax=Clostridium sp. D33t1_170424_F3 TaxID=2787099 RepID=UPI0018AC3EB9|nr:response regulator [Clostridium sp. D33t1_170424_F3]